MRAVVGSDTLVYSPRFVGTDEVPADCATTPTIAATSAAGESLAALTAASVTGQAGQYTTTLTADSHLTAPDLLTLTWTGIVSGADRILTQQVDVAGSVYVPTYELLELRTVSDSGAQMARLRHWREVFEALVERARGTAYVRRLAVDTFRGDGGSRLRLSERHPRVLRAVTIDGVAQSLSGFDLDVATRTVVAETYFPWGEADNITVAYEHGYDAPPAALVEACREYVRARSLADNSDQQRTVLSFTNLASGEVYRFGTADWAAGRFTGLEIVDTLIRSVPDERTPGLA